MSPVYPDDEGTVELMMPVSSIQMKVFAPVAALAVVIVTVPASAFAEAVAIVGRLAGPEYCVPLMSALQSELAAAVVEARDTSNPCGKVITICPPSGIEVAARKFTR